METKFDQAIKWVGVVLLALFAAAVAGVLLYWVYGELSDKSRHIVLVLVTLGLVAMFFLGEALGRAYRSGFEDAHSNRTIQAVNAPPQTTVYTPPQTIIDQTDRLPASYAAISPDLNDRILQAVKGSEL